MSERYTSEFTPDKQRHFEQIVSTHVRMCRGIIKKWLHLHRHYCYLDLYAGSGYYAPCRPGSPLIFANIAAELNVPFYAYLFENHEITLQQLRQNVTEWKDQQIFFDNFYIECIEGNNSEEVPELLATLYDNRARYGLVYVDPPGNVPCFDALRVIASDRRFKCVDVLLYLSGTNLKRFRKCGVVQYSDYLEDALKRVGKSHIHIREFQGRHQWTFALLTNWEGFPEFTSMGFHRLSTPQGRRIMDVLNYTKDELDGKE